LLHNDVVAYGSALVLSSYGEPKCSALSDVPQLPPQAGYKSHDGKIAVGQFDTPRDSVIRGAVSR
jgi:hypothetical protein